MFLLGKNLGFGKATILSLLLLWLCGCANAAWSSENDIKYHWEDQVILNDDIITSEETLHIESYLISFDGAVITDCGYFYAVTVSCETGEEVLDVDFSSAVTNDVEARNFGSSEFHVLMRSTNDDQSVTYVYNCVEEFRQFESDEYLIIEPIINGQTDGKAFQIPVTSFIKAINIELGYEKTASRDIYAVQIVPWGIVVGLTGDEEYIKDNVTLQITYDDNSTYSMEGTSTDPVLLKEEDRFYYLYVPTTEFIPLEGIKTISLSF